MSPRDMTAPLRQMGRRVLLMVGRAVVKAVNDAAGIQALQLAALDGELIEDAERMQDYGFSSVPFPGAEAVLVFPGGLRSHGLVVAVGDRRYRLKGLQAGEVAMYDDLAQSIVLTRDGIRIASAKSIEIESGERFRATAPIIELIGEVVVGGEDGQGKPVARHDDPVVAGKVVATALKARAL